MQHQAVAWYAPAAGPRTGFSNALFLPHGTPNTTKQGWHTAPDALESVFRCRLRSAGELLGVDGLAKMCLPLVSSTGYPLPSGRCHQSRNHSAAAGPSSAAPLGGAHSSPRTRQAPPLGRAPRAPAAQPARDHAVHHRQNRCHQLGLRGQQQAQRDRQRQHLLAYRNLRNDVVHQMRRRLRHASGPA